MTHDEILECQSDRFLFDRLAFMDFFEWREMVGRPVHVEVKRLLRAERLFLAQNRTKCGKGKK